MRFSEKCRVGIIGILAVALAVGAGWYAVEAKSLSSITSDSIRKKEDQISQMEQERTRNQDKLSDLQKMKKDLETKKSNLKSYVAQLDSNLAEIEQNINDLNQQISDKESEIEETTKELADAQEAEQTKQTDMISHIRMMYERDDIQVVELFVTAGSFSGFLSRADAIERIADYEKQMYDDYKANRQLVELCKEQLELEKEILDETRENVEAEQANLEVLIDQKTQDIIAYETDINNQADAIAEYEQMIKDQDAEIAALEEAIAAEKKDILKESGDVITYDGGAFKFPVASYTRVSDDYGMRIHPTLGVEQFHNGVDLASPKGTAIYAAYDGKVVAATYSATMGNYIMIDHGDELYTIYMHASALYVKKGDIVVRGETIAAVGSTGRSTGNHLHFSVRKNGSYVSPWNYISK